MRGLTKKQSEIIEFIEDFIASRRFSPSYRDIKQRFGFSSLGSVYNHVQSLKKKGFLVGDKRAPLFPEKFQQKKREVPLIGTLAAGQPIETCKQIMMLPIAEEFASEEECYFLKISGNGLIEEGMIDGDLLVVKPQNNCQPGETVLALVDREITLVKKLFPDPPLYRFESANPDVRPFQLREDHVEIQGIITALIRHYSS